MGDLCVPVRNILAFGRLLLPRACLPRPGYRYNATEPCQRTVPEPRWVDRSWERCRDL